MTQLRPLIGSVIDPINYYNQVTRRGCQMEAEIIFFTGRTSDSTEDTNNRTKKSLDFQI